MALEPTLIKPRDLPAQADVFASDAVMVDDGVTVGKATPVQVVNAGAPVSSEAQALAGVDNATRMTPLRVRQVVNADTSGSVALARAWAESDTPPDPLDPESKSAKTWAELAAEYSVLAGFYFEQSDADMASVAISDNVNVIQRRPLSESPGQVAPLGELTWWARTEGPTVEPYFVTAGGVIWTQTGPRIREWISAINSAITALATSPELFGAQPFPSLAAFNAATIPASVQRVGVVVEQVPATNLWTVEFVRQSGAAYAGLKPGWVPDGDPTQRHFVTTTSPGVTDVTADLNAFLAYCGATNKSPLWTGTASGPYRVDGNLVGFHNKFHRGTVRLNSNGNNQYIGSEWQADLPVTLFVSPTGLSTNDGLSSANPLDFVSGFNCLEELAAQNPRAQYEIIYLAGTYPNAAGRLLDEFPATKNTVMFSGEVDGSDVPTTIFSNWNGPTFRKLTGNNGVNVRFRNMRWNGGNSDNGAIMIRNNGVTSFENLWARDFSAAGPIFAIRGGNGTVQNMDIWNTSGSGAVARAGVVVQDFYGEVGASKIDGIVDGGLGNAIDASRGGSSYLENNELGLREANDNHILAGPLKRDRIRNNKYGPFNNTVYSGNELTVWNFDPAFPDDMSAMSAVVGNTVAALRPGAFYSRVHNGLSKVGHRFLNTSVPITGTARTLLRNLDSNAIPFRMPAWWLLSPRARGWLELEFQAPVAENITVELSGESVSVSDRLAFDTIPLAAAGRFKMRMEFTGPLNGENTGRFTFETLMAAGNRNVFGDTGNLNSVAVTGSTQDDRIMRLYITRSVGTGDLVMTHFESYVSI